MCVWCLGGVYVLSVMWLDLESVSEISSPRWLSVYECGVCVYITCVY